MEYMGKSREKAGHAPSDGGLYRALASGDLPAAWLITKAFTARPEADKTVYATAFNCGLCLYRLEEYEKALAELKRAEQLLGNPPDFDISEKKLLLQALALSGKEAALLPLDRAFSKTGCSSLTLPFILATWAVLLTAQTAGIGPAEPAIAPTVAASAVAIGQMSAGDVLK